MVTTSLSSSVVCCNFNREMNAYIFFRIAQKAGTIPFLSKSQLCGGLNGSVSGLYTGG